MDESEELLCLFSAAVADAGGSHVIELPGREIENGGIEPGDAYRVALIRGDTPREHPGTGDRPHEGPQPPVEPGEMRYVEIEDLGKQGDGIARVERGYVIIVPDVEVGDRVKIEISDVKPNFAVSEIVEIA